jgi:feruloyl-CoA synthase
MVRRVHVERARTAITPGEHGTFYLRHPASLPPYPVALTDRLVHWAGATPGRSFVAERDAHGVWQHLTYAHALERVQHVAQALLERGLSPERPVVILSGNSTDHLVLALACMHVGVPYAPVAPAYSLLPPQRAGERASGAPGLAREFDALRYVCDVMQPGLVFAADAAAFDRAVAVVSAGSEVVASTGTFTHRGHTPFTDLEVTAVTRDVHDAHERVTGDTIAKILFTSGSTGRPKAVINTHRMLSSNQAMLLAMMPFLAEHPLVLCDWLPWNHTFGGNHNVGIVLYNGGMLYLDAGRPLPDGMDATLRNLRDVAPTAYFNVPRGYELLMPHLKADAAFRAHFFSRVKLLFYAAAGLGQRFWDELRDVAVDACGEEILMMTGLGATESAPYAISTGADGALSGMIGLPVPGVELKLVPTGTKLEARLRGPNVTPGFFRQPELTAAAFDEEGFYKLGDAVRWIDPADPAKGLMFDGRLNEDFKLSTGTWVSVGPLRVRFLQHFAGLAQDVVICAPDRARVTALVFPAMDACRALAVDLSGTASPAVVLAHPAVRARFQALLTTLAHEQRGSAAIVARILLLDSRPSFDHREITDKGSLNQKAVLAHRAALVDDLYRDPPPSHVIVCDAGPN